MVATQETKYEKTVNKYRALRRATQEKGRFTRKNG